MPSARSRMLDMPSVRVGRGAAGSKPTPLSSGRDAQAIGVEAKLHVRARGVGVLDHVV